MSKGYRAVASAVFMCIFTVALQTAVTGQEELIAEVTVEGNSYVAKEAILDKIKDVLNIGQSYTEEKAAQARQLITEMGYFDEVVTSVERVDKGVRVVITVVEKRRVQHVMFAGNTVASDQELRDTILTQPGHIVDMRVIRDDVRRIEEHYQEKGYIATVADAGTDDFGVLTFIIEEARLEEVVIEGLRRTQEFVVRRELDLEPGELYQQDKVTQSLLQVKRTGHFEDVEIGGILPGKVDPLKGVILVIKVEEAKTGRAAFALGYSSLDNLVVMLSARETNLRGRGQSASISLELGGRESYELSFGEPYLTADGTSLEVNLFDTQRRRRFVGGAAVTTADDEFDEQRTGGNFTITKPLTRRRSVSLRFRSEEVSSSLFQGTVALPPASGIVSPSARPGPAQVGNIPGHGGGVTPAPDNPELTPDIPEPGDIVGRIVVASPLHPGGRLTSVTLGLNDERRDNPSDPIRGFYSGISYEQAGGFLGGEEEFGKLTIDHRRYFPVGKKGQVVAVRLLGGVSLGSPPLFESFSIGGANTLRGYDPDRWRGENMLLLNAEYRHPITDKLKAVGFVDVGDAFGGAFRTIVPGFSVSAEDHSFEPHVGAGVGLRVSTPLGPIRLDFGWGTEGNQAHFSFGHAF